MKKLSDHIKIASCFCAMLILILDSKTAAAGAVAGIEICLRSAIPSLFPAMILSDILTRNMNSGKLPFPSFLRRVCGIPEGSESIFLAGILGGYPIGARLIGQASKSEALTKQDAEHMLSFCSNAGPAFIFGICGGLFSWYWAPLALWAIHVLSALLTGAALRNSTKCEANQHIISRLPITAIVSNGVKSMGIVCGWIVLFRVIIEFMQRWILWLFPPAVSVLISGVLELTNGCCLLSQISNESLRFLLCSILLSVGGFCVLLQTAAVTEGLCISAYLKGKLLQTAFSILLCAPLLITGSFHLPIRSNLLIIPFLIFLIAATLHYFKKRVAFQKKMIYNTKKCP